MATDREIIDVVTDFFVKSRDFNGIAAATLGERLGASWQTLKGQLAQLVKEGKLDLTFASHSENPHIKRVPVLPPDQQIARLETEEPHYCCVYPKAAAVSEVLDLRQYDDRPFTKRLLLVEPQLTPVFFDLDVLDPYFRDPRYHFDFHDFTGSISIADKYYKSSEVKERDKVLLQSFGIGYDEHKNRVVVVFLRYLADLSPEHQQTWKAKEVVGLCRMNGDYARASINGEWSEYYSVYQAFIQEQVEINKLAELIGKQKLFNKTFDDDRPAGFHPMLRPTQRNFEEFVSLLDKMVSENINRDFFRVTSRLNIGWRRAMAVSREGHLAL